MKKNEFPHIKNLVNHFPGSPEIVKKFGLLVGTYVRPHTKTKDPAVQKGGSAVQGLVWGGDR